MPAAAADGGFDFFAALWRGAWLRFLPERLREPTARLVVLGALALVSMFLFAPAADQRGEAYIESTFARTLAALAATRGLDSAISLAQSSEVSFSFGPGGSLGIGQALDPVNDLVESLETQAKTAWRNWKVGEAVDCLFRARAIVDASEGSSPSVHVPSISMLESRLPFLLRNTADAIAFAKQIGYGKFSLVLAGMGALLAAAVWFAMYFTQ